ncbi:MAG: LysR family transcriptional regulator [Alphaproteobacteria bacterium]|nr:LysR family transcriptional regulator [Alphaproteobacteria bacterium]
MDQLTALRVFRRVAELGGFAAAARDLDLSNAAVSKNVRELEEALGARLINRTTRRMHLTEAGAAYLAKTRAILDQLSEADAAVADAGAAPRGLLRVAAPMSVGIAHVAPAAAAFLQAYPDVRLELSFDDRAIDIVEGGFDVAIRGAARLKDSSLIARRVGGLDRVVCAAPAYVKRRPQPKTPADLSAHDCLIYTLSSAPRRWTFTRKGKGQSANVAGPLSVNNSLALAAAARAGLGVALVPHFAAEGDLASGALVRLLPDWACEPAALYALTPRHRQAEAKVRLFIDHMAKALR